MRKQTIPPSHLNGKDLIEWVQSETAKAETATEVKKKAIIQAVASSVAIRPDDKQQNGQTFSGSPDDDAETLWGASAPTQRPKNCVLSHSASESAESPVNSPEVAGEAKSRDQLCAPLTLMDIEGFLPKSDEELCERIHLLFGLDIYGFYGELAQEHEVEFQIVRMLFGYFEGDKTKALDFTEERLSDCLTIESAESIWHRITAPAWALEKALGYSRPDWDHPYLCRTLHHRSRTRQLAQAAYLLHRIHGADSWFLLNQKTLAALLNVTQQDIARMLSTLVRVGWLKRQKRHGSRSLEYQCLGHLQEVKDDE